MKNFAVIFFVFFFPILTNAQDVLPIKQTSFVIGGEVEYKCKYLLNNGHKYKVAILNTKVKFGYFLSENDLFLIRPWIAVNRSRKISSDDHEGTFSIGTEIVYRRYLWKSVFGGAFLGGDYKRKLYSYSSTVTIDYDREIYTGAEIGYTLFLNSQVGIEPLIYLSYGRHAFEREIDSYINQISIGLNIGFLYLFKF